MNWYEILQNKVRTLGRRQVEDDTGMSKTTLSQVLNQKYRGSMFNIERQVITAYTNISVECPVLGIIPVKRCNSERVKPFIGSNPVRVNLYKACQVCKHNKDINTNESA